MKLEHCGFPHFPNEELLSVELIATHLREDNSGEAGLRGSAARGLDLLLCRDCVCLGPRLHPAQWSVYSSGSVNLCCSNRKQIIRFHSFTKNVLKH